MSANRRQQALVLGGAGFIGRWVTRELLQRGVPVTAVVRDPVAAGQALAAWRKRPELAQADLETPGTGADLVARMQPSLVFNLAGYGVDRGETDGIRAQRLNHHLVRELAEAIAATTGATLVHVGSAAEYGNATGMLHEDDATEATGTYGETKLAGTRALVQVANRTGGRAVCARLFTVFGQGEHEGRLLPMLRTAARTGTPVPLSEGTQERDFAWVGDVATALVDLAGAAWAPGAVVNVASGRSHTVRAFVLAAAQRLGIPREHLQFGAVASRPGDLADFTVSVARMRQLVGRALPGDLDAMVAAALPPIP